MTIDSEEIRLGCAYDIPLTWKQHFSIIIFLETTLCIGHRVLRSSHKHSNWFHYIKKYPGFLNPWYLGQITVNFIDPGQDPVQWQQNILYLIKWLYDTLLIFKKVVT